VPDAWTPRQLGRGVGLARAAGPARTLDVPTATAPKETLDVFRTAAAGAPVLVFIHGGYWRALDKSDHSFVAPSFMADGAVVVVPNYALARRSRIEHITLQMVRPWSGPSRT
jgi:arylformamidase